MEFEASYWLSRPRAGEILIVVTSGKYASWDEVRQNALPPTLRKAIVDEPLWIDIVDRCTAIENTDPSALQAQLTEDLRQLILVFYPGRSWPELRGEERTQRRKAVALVWAFTAALTSATGTAVWMATEATKQRDVANTNQIEAQRNAKTAAEQRDVAEQRLAQAESRQLAAQSEYLHTKIGQLSLSSLLALESVRRLPNLESRSAVASALDLTVRERFLLEDQPMVDSLAISPDGKWLATAKSGGDGGASIWNAVNGRWRFNPEHKGPVNAVTFSPDSKWLASGSDDGYVRIFNVATGRERFRTYIGRVQTVAFSSDGKWLAAATGGLFERKNAFILDTATGRGTYFLQHEPMTNVAFSPDGKWLATASDDNAVVIRDMATGLARTRLDYKGNLIAMATSPNGKWIAIGSDDTVRVFDPITGRERSKLEHSGPVKVLAFDPDGSWLASAGGDFLRHQ